ncbi:amino acid permease [Sulfurimonas sp. SAG-AH-194-L11]|nr:APC family permease [Sulfurimonas sp. SAG-AH-194-L11]MDF1876825.1 amino acid permease [Sulfurimonas sp. SAG-AH-194-L11]
MQTDEKKAFGLWSAVFLGIGSMVGAGIFIVIGQAGAIAGNLLIYSFLLAALIALLCGYSLSKLAIAYPSRGGIIEYLIQSYGENVFSGALGVLFYFAQLIAIAAVAKSFGTYASTYIIASDAHSYINIFAIAIVVLFVVINLIGASLVAKSENIIVIVKLTALIAFGLASMFYITPSHFSLKDAPASINIFYSLGLTFFAFQGFSVITNSVEDMDNPKVNMLKSMFITIGLVTFLYLLITVAVFGNLSLAEIIKSQDFALAQAAEPIFGSLGFKLIAATALLATASAINATLYSATQISYDLARHGDLPDVYERHVFHNSEGLIISAILIIPMLLFFNLGEIASIASVSVLLIQGFTHIGHLFKLKETHAKINIVLLAIVGTFLAAGFAIYYTSKSIENFGFYILGLFVFAFILEIILRLVSARIIQKNNYNSRLF